MIAIYKRELKALLSNVLGWLFFGICSSMYGLFYSTYQLMGGYSNISYSLSSMPYVFLILAPILSMRMFAKERKDRADRLIMTAPVSIKGIVFGKYLALLTILAIEEIYMLLTSILLYAFGDVNMLVNLTSLLGMFLFGASIMAIALFASSLFENQALSAVCALAFLFVGIIVPPRLNSVFESKSIGAGILGTIDLASPLSEYLSGILSVSSLIYYPVIASLFLFLTGQILFKRRFNISRKTFSLSAFSVGGVVVAIILTLVINVLLTKLPEDSQIDFSEAGLFTLSTTTKDYIKELPGEVEIFVYSSEESTDYVIKKMLSLYEENSKQIKVSYVDPTTNPAFAESKNASDLTGGGILVSSKIRNKVIDYSELYETEIDYNTYSQRIIGFDGEGQVTSAIDSVFIENNPKIYFLEGHDEALIGSRLDSAIKKSNIDTEYVHFLNAKSVPKDCDVLIVNAPATDLSGDDIKKIKDYVDKGGNVVFSISSLSKSENDNYRALLLEYGFDVADGAICETDTNKYYNVELFLLPTVEPDAVTTGLEGERSVFSPYNAGFLIPIEDEEDNKEDEDDLQDNGSINESIMTSIITTSNTAFAKPAITSEESLDDESIVGKIKKEEGDIEGPFSLGAYIDYKTGSRLYAFGSPYMFSDSADEIVSGRNTALFINVINSMVSQVEGKLNASLPVKYYQTPSLTVTENISRVYSIVFIALFPLVFIFVGLAIWTVRRRK